MLIVGVTGGIGSGKSEFAKALESLGMSRIDADAVGKNVLDSDPDLQQRIIQTFGDEVLDSQHQINRSALAKRVFQNNEVLATFNAMIQPALVRQIEKIIDDCQMSERLGAVILDMAILFETGLDKKCHHVVVVTAPETVRVARVQAAKNWSVEDIHHCMARQMSESDYVKKADTVIRNSDTLASLEEDARYFYERVVEAQKQ